MRPYFRALRFQRLQTIKMICMIMANYHTTDRLRRYAANGFYHRLAQCRRGQRIKHHYAVIGDDKASKRQKTKENHTSHARLAMKIIYMRRNLDWRELY